MSLSKDGTEVKKDTEWLRKKVLELKNNGNAEANQTETEAERERGRLLEWALYNCVDRVCELIDQLDEPEVLSQEWIDEHARDSYYGVWVYTDDLQNLLVPKEELPVVPELVADHIQSSKDMGLTLYSAMENVIEDYGNKINDWLWDGVGDDSFQVFAKAWLAYPNIVVEEEQKYIIKIAERDFMVMDDDGVMYPTDINVPKYKYQFTEQEIKDYDERLWPFAVKVEE